MKSKSWIIKGFVFIFVAFLIFPNAGLFRGEKNVAMIAKENRKITAFPKSSPKEKGFYTNFEKWYQDRLRYRDKMIGLWTRVNFSMGVVLKDHIFVGERGWLFNKNRFIKDFRDPDTKILRIKALQEYCNRQGKNFIFFVAPPKESVYEDYFPQREQNKQKRYLRLEEQLIELCKMRGVNYLPIGNDVMNKRYSGNDDLFFHDDHHWSYYGSVIGAKLLLERMAIYTNAIDNFRIVLDGSKVDAFKEYSYARELGLPRNSNTVAPWNKHFTDEIYVTSSIDGKTIKVDKILSNDILWGRIVRGEAIIENKAIDKGITVLFLGDSSGSYMMPYVSQKVKRIISTHYRDCVDKKKSVDIGRLMKQYKPDVVVLEMGGPGFFNSKGDTNFKNMVF